LSSECAEFLGASAIHLFANVARVRNPIPAIPLGCIQSRRTGRSCKCWSSECAKTLGRRAVQFLAIVARARNPTAGVPLVGCTDIHTDACGPRQVLYNGTSRYQRAPGARKSYPLTWSSRLYLFTNAFCHNGGTTSEPSSIQSLQIFATSAPLPPLALLRFARRAAVPEIQSV